MAYMNCPLCGKLFNQHGFYEVCDSCFADNQEDFNKIRDYLYSNANKNILEVSQATGVTVEKIQKFLRQGRLISS